MVAVSFMTCKSTKPHLYTPSTTRRASPRGPRQSSVYGWRPFLSLVCAIACGNATDESGDTGDGQTVPMFTERGPMNGSSPNDNVPPVDPSGTGTGSPSGSGSEQPATVPLAPGSGSPPGASGENSPAQPPPAQPPPAQPPPAQPPPAQPPPAQPGNCDAPPAADPVIGWAAVNGNGVATTTGGGNATPITVTTLAQLQNAVLGTDPAVIFVKGILAPGEIRPGSNKTIAGICGAEIHGHVEVSGAVNVIIRNIKLVGFAPGNCALDPGFDPAVGCSSGDDLITVQRNSHHVWFDHCDISDGTDGNLDISNGADFVTISWTKFHYTARTDNVGDDSTGAAGHRYSDLVGGSDNTTADANLLNVTWHHNWWADNVVERQPRVRFGENHLFNNYWASPTTNYCVRAGIQAHLLIENSYFDGVDSPHQFNNEDDQQTASITVRGNIYDNTSGDQETGGGGPAFTNPPYNYTLDAAAAVPNLVQQGAGPK
jgi:pectate lyase